MNRFAKRNSRDSESREPRRERPVRRGAPRIEKRNVMHPRDRAELLRKEGVVVTAPVPAHRRFAAPAGTAEEKAAWYRNAWVEAKLPRGAFSALVSVEDPLDGGYGESYSTAQDHFGKYVLKAISKDYEKSGELELSPRHRELYRVLQEHLRRPHLAALRAALVAVHVRSVGEKFLLILQLHRASAAIVSETKKFAEWAGRELESVVGVHSLLLRQTVPAALGNVPPNAELRELSGPNRIEIPFGDWPVPLLLHPLEGARPHRTLWPEMAKECCRLLQLRKGDAVADLCSGSGVFALEAARKGVSVVALDRKAGVREALHLNAARLKVQPPAFVQSELNSNALARILERLEGHRKVVLDLPGMQTPPGVPQICEAMSVDKVARIYGNLHQLAEEIHRWRAHGYMLHKARAYDTRPGGPGLEIVALFRRDNDGLLGGKPGAKRTFVRNARGAAPGRPRPERPGRPARSGNTEPNAGTVRFRQE